MAARGAAGHISCCGLRASSFFCVERRGSKLLSCRNQVITELWGTWIMLFLPFFCLFKTKTNRAFVPTWALVAERGTPQWAEPAVTFFWGTKQRQRMTPGGSQSWQTGEQRLWKYEHTYAMELTSCLHAGEPKRRIFRRCRHQVLQTDVSRFLSSDFGRLETFTEK